MVIADEGIGTREEFEKRMSKLREKDDGVRGGELVIGPGMRMLAQNGTKQGSTTHSPGPLRTSLTR